MARFDGASHWHNHYSIAMAAYCRPLYSDYGHSHCDANDCDDDDDAYDNRRCWVEILDRWMNHRALDFVCDVDSPLEMNSLFIEIDFQTRKSARIPQTLNESLAFSVQLSDFSQFFNCLLFQSLLTFFSTGDHK